MRTHRQWLNYQKLELISDQQSEAKRRDQVVLSAFKNIWDMLLTTLITGSEPRIWQTIDSSGKTGWKVYDPKTERVIQLSSEAEVRTWLDESFSRQATPPYAHLRPSSPYSFGSRRWSV